MPAPLEVMETLKESIQLEQKVKDVYIRLLEQCVSDREKLRAEVKRIHGVALKSACRSCSIPMVMVSWDQQFCQNCEGNK